MVKSYRFLILFVIFGRIASADPIDFPKVNSVIQDIVDTFISGDDTVEYAKPQFDKGSDLDAGYLRYNLYGVLKSTPWSPNSKAQLRASSGFFADRRPEHSGIKVISKARIGTDTLAMIRHGAELSLLKLNGAPPKFAVRIKETFTNLSKVQDLKQLYEVMVAAQALSLEIEDYRILKLKSYLGCVQRGECEADSSMPIEDRIARANNAVEKFKNIRKGIEGVKIQASPSPEQVSAIKIETLNLSAFAGSERFSVVPAYSHMVLKEQSVSLQIQGFAKLSVEKLTEMKTNLEKALNRVADNEPKQLDKSDRMLKKALIVFKQAIREGSIQP